MQKGYTCLKFTLGGEARGEHVNTYNTAFERWVLRRTLTKLMYYRFVLIGTPTEARPSLASGTYLEYLLRLGGTFIFSL